MKERTRQGKGTILLLVIGGVWDLWPSAKMMSAIRNCASCCLVVLSIRFRSRAQVGSDQEQWTVTMPPSPRSVCPDATANVISYCSQGCSSIVLEYQVRRTFSSQKLTRATASRVRPGALD